MKRPPVKRERANRHEIVTENIGGNLHQATDYLNRNQLGKWLLQMWYASGGNNTIVVLRMPSSEAKRLRKAGVL